MSVIQALKSSPIFNNRFMDRINRREPLIVLKDKDKDKLKVFVVICVHRDCRVKQINLLKQLEMCPYVHFQYAFQDGDALIDRSRSRVATYFLQEKPEYEILLFLDDDIIYKPQDIMQLVVNMKEKDLDILGGMYVTKNEKAPVPTIMGLNANEDFKFGKDGMVEEVMAVSTGCMAIRRRVLQKMVDSGQMKMCHSSTVKFYPFFMPEVRELFGDYHYLSEDWAYCVRARDLGFKVWIDCSIKLGHIGDKVYDWDDIGCPQKEEKENILLQYHLVS